MKHFHQSTTKVLFLIFFASSLYRANAQTLNESGADMINAKNAYNTIEGNPYLPNENFVECQLLNSSKQKKRVMARLNTHTGVLEYIENGKQMRANNLTVEAVFTQSNEVYRSGFQPVEKQTLLSFYQVLYEGKTKLLKYTYAKIEEFQGINDVNKGKFAINDLYYILSQNGSLQRTKLDKKTILGLLDPAKKDAITAMVDKENLKLKKVEDLIKVLTWQDEMN
jgi:hypothetical protein